MESQNRSENFCTILIKSNFDDEAKQIENALQNYNVERILFENKEEIKKVTKDLFKKSLINVRFFLFIVISNGTDGTIECENENEAIKINEILEVFVDNQKSLTGIPIYFFFI